MDYYAVLLRAQLAACEHVRPGVTAASVDEAARDIIAAAGCAPERFLPYLQPYEFEALLFSDVAALTALEVRWAGAVGKLQAVRDSAESPEHINDGPTTKPAARLTQFLTQPKYSKTLHGPIAVSLIGLPKIEQECRYFAGWLAALRALAAPGISEGAEDGEAV